MSGLNKLIGCVLFIFAFYAARGQEQNPITWSFEAKKTADNEYDLVFTAKIDKGYHLYSQVQDIPADKAGPIPTSFTFTESKEYTLVENAKEISKLVVKKEDNFDIRVRYFENKAIFVQHIKINGALNSVKGSLEFMTCNDRMCLPPQTVDFEFNLNK